MKVELICFLYNKKLVEDLGIKSKDTPANFTIDTQDIESVRQRIADDESEICEKTSMVYTKSGCSYVVGKSYKEMLKLWEQ